MQNVIEDLRRAVDEAVAHFAEFNEADTSAPLADGKWSRKQLLGHLIDSAANNHQRFIRAQLNEPKTFPGYEQEPWVERNGYADASWGDLVALWQAYNLHLLRVIARIPADQLDVSCTVGGSEPMTLGFIAEDYVRHLKHHLQQIFA
ncbi:MAG TPA: DinB family protein [Blastocatellia bacterium]|nr:DinB family protein [Blastocatellia bacterium]